MADYFTRFSFMLPMPSAEEAEACVSGHLSDLARDPDASGGFTVTAEGNVLWIRDDHGQADLDAVVAFVLASARAHGLSGLFALQFAQTCSKPRAGAFGGGAIVLDLDSAEVFDHLDIDIWCAEVIARHGQTAPLASV